MADDILEITWPASPLFDEPDLEPEQREALEVILGPDLAHEVETAGAGILEPEPPPDNLPGGAKMMSLEQRKALEAIGGPELVAAVEAVADPDEKLEKRPRLTLARGAKAGPLTRLVAEGLAADRPSFLEAFQDANRRAQKAKGREKPARPIWEELRARQTRTEAATPWLPQIMRHLNRETVIRDQAAATMRELEITATVEGTKL